MAVLPTQEAGRVCAPHPSFWVWPCVFLWPLVEVMVCPFQAWVSRGLACFCQGWEKGFTKVTAPLPPAWPWEQTHVEQPLAQTSVKSLAQPHSSWPQTGQVIKCFYYMLLGLCGCLLHTIIMIVANGCSYQWSVFPAPVGPLVLIQRCTMYFPPWIPHSYLDLCSSQHQQF